MCTFYIGSLKCRLVNLDGAIDLPDEPVACGEANGATKEEDINRHDKRVAKVDDGRSEALKSQLGAVVVARVDEEVDGGEARCCVAINNLIIKK